LPVVFEFEKLRSYLIGPHVIIFINHAVLKRVIKKKDSKPKLIRRIMLLQEFDCEIKDKKDFENSIANHLSRIVTSDAYESPIFYYFPEEQLFGAHLELRSADIVNYLVTRKMAKG